MTEPKAAVPASDSQIKLIASDLDGTVLGHDFTMSQRTIDAFGAARDAGYEVVFATGRPPMFLDPLKQSMGAEGAGHDLGLVISANGAAVYDIQQEQVLFSHTLGAEAALETMHGIRERLPRVLFGADYVRGASAEEGFPMRMSGSHFAIVPDFFKDIAQNADAAGGILKFYARDPESTDADALAELICPVLAEGAAVTVSVAGIAMAEISLAGVTKGKTLEEFAAKKGISREQVMAFGDMPNDVAMLTWAGHGYAMASGHPLAHEAAGRRAPAFEEDGVAQVIEELLATGKAPEGI